MYQLNPQHCPVAYDFGPHQPEQYPELDKPGHGVPVVKEARNLFHLLHQRADVRALSVQYHRGDGRFQDELADRLQRGRFVLGGDRGRSGAGSTSSR